MGGAYQLFKLARTFAGVDGYLDGSFPRRCLVSAARRTAAAFRPFRCRCGDQPPGRTPASGALAELEPLQCEDSLLHLLAFFAKLIQDRLDIHFFARYGVLSIRQDAKFSHALSATFSFQRLARIFTI